ncbi:putative periplasmic protein (DUF2233) [Opitutaceae bacterium TAV1]|nr:putative periplasmic protein (DUF2233) [Opitutaceae bacterium TAV1]
MSSLRPVRLVTLWFSLAVAVAGFAAEWADPRGFFDDEKITTTPIAPGLVRIEAQGNRDGLRVETQVLAVDLHPREGEGAAAWRLETLTGQRRASREAGHYFPRSTPRQLLEDNPGTLATINASFFDIRSTQVPLGLVVRGGQLLREPMPQLYPSVLALADGRVLIARPDWRARVVFRGQERPLAGINLPTAGNTDIALYRPPWERAPEPAAVFSKADGTLEIMLRRSRAKDAAPEAQAGMEAAIAAVRAGTDHVPQLLASDEMSLIAGREAAPFFRDARPGERIEIFWTLTGLPDGVRAEDVRDAVSGSTILIAAGRRTAGSGSFWETRHPRSAAGVDATGRRVVLVVADGRSQRSAGMNLTTLTDYLVHLGAHDALNFDGGGSSALVTRSEGRPQVLNRPSDGRERLIPAALGVVRATDSKTAPPARDGETAPPPQP